MNRIVSEVLRAISSGIATFHVEHNRIQTSDDVAAPDFDPTQIEDAEPWDGLS